MASVKFDAQEARSLVKMGVYKTKPNPIISYKTTILPESSLRLSCLFAIQTCNVRRENGLFLSGKGKKKKILVLGLVVFSIEENAFGLQGPLVREHLLSQYSESLMFF